jgi:multisubunit Na+/H+ antiporter MnhC subunit
MSTALYLAALVVGLAALGVALVFDLRRTKEAEDAMIKRLDDAMQAKDDPNEPARWVP